MPSSRLDEVRDYAFADQALALRRQANLTQRELAELLQVSSQAIHAWESGLSYPGTAHRTVRPSLVCGATRRIRRSGEGGAAPPAASHRAGAVARLGRCACRGGGAGAHA